MYNIPFKAYRNKRLKDIHQLINVSAWVWNHSLALQKRYYRLTGKYIDVGKLQKHIAKKRKKNTEWMKLNSQSVQEICQRLDKSYQRFFKGKAKRPPRFKKTRNFSSFVLKQSGWSLDNNTLVINKIGKFKFSKSRDFDNIKRISVKRNKLGEIFFIICCDIEPTKYDREGNSSIGIDFGLKQYLTLSNGETINSPEFFKSEISNIRKLHKEFSSKVKGSSNKYRSLRKLQAAYLSISNKRKDFHWKLAHKLCKGNEYIFLEDLNISAMKKLWGRKVSDLSFSNFVNILEQVALKYDTKVHKINRFFPSSKLCECGSVNSTLTLSDREWACTDCGIVNQRDLNAANNILRQGIVSYRTKHQTDLSAV